ncbi:hypothetical protein K402DRAFT_62841 [Aulographum hederae CBS 113979]|uniref:Uncharacterized protein n=1 Tax=Aulographum hederae CBS 113979 TaxID=1176131 RepID=A0A6G1H286_9PEZI|nr:hypothetical protein K402DRAFT_62841 [Aulographum hederae CBS 113979]
MMSISGTRALQNRISVLGLLGIVVPKKGSLSDSRRKFHHYIFSTKTSSIPDYERWSSSSEMGCYVHSSPHQTWFSTKFRKMTPDPVVDWRKTYLHSLALFVFLLPSSKGCFYQDRICKEAGKGGTASHCKLICSFRPSSLEFSGAEFLHQDQSSKTTAV